MILTQAFIEVGVEGMEPVGTYYDEVSLATAPGYGLNKEAHMVELQKRAEAKGAFVVAAIYESEPAPFSHPSYNRIVVSVTGDLYKKV